MPSAFSVSRRWPAMSCSLCSSVRGRGRLCERCTCVTDNEFSHRHTRFLLAEGEIAGMLHGFPARAVRDAQSGRSLWLMLRHARFEVLRLIIAAVVLRDILDFIGQDLDSGDFYISILAIDPPYRGRNLSKALLAEAERLAVEQNCVRLALDVDERNAVARAAYQRAGFDRSANRKRQLSMASVGGCCGWRNRSRDGTSRRWDRAT